jgi:hypothetical protein
MVVRALFVILGLWNFAHAEDGTAQEFLSKKQYYRDRLVGFYDRLEELDRQDEERRKGEQETRIMRRKISDEYEQDRRDYVRNRRPKTLADDTAWEAELKARREAYERDRREYVKKRNDLEQAIRSVLKIDANEELGIETN